MFLIKTICLYLKPLFYFMRNKFYFLFFTLFILFINVDVFSQEETIEIIRMSDVNFQNTSLLFEEYELIGKHCKNNNGIEKHCLKEERLLDNNIEELLIELENTLTYLEIQNELIPKVDLEKEIYADKSFYRYVFSAEPKISKKGNSCFSNPGALIFRYNLYDRLENKNYKIALDYAFYICDIQILVNDINKNLRKAIKNKKD